MGSSGRQQETPGGKSWWQVLGLPGFHAQVRPSPETWTSGPGALQARGRHEGRLGEELCGSMPVLASERCVREPGRQTLQGHANSRSPPTSSWGYISSHNSDSSWGKTEGCPKLTETMSITTAEWGALAPD